MLDDTDSIRFSSAVEGSFDVGSRQQFFVWTQSAVQGLVPHQILLCGVRDPGSQAMLLEHFSASRYFRKEQFDAVGHPQLGLLQALLAAYADSGDIMLFSPLSQADSPARHLDEVVAGNELQNLAAMLVQGVDGQVEAWYGFARVSSDFDAELRRRIELMVPHIHRTFVRVLARERGIAMRIEPAGERLITRRQAEILLLIRDGKTNAEIADLLECSPWTIKNHIQNILRRLNTNSRAHAIAVAMRKGILRPD